MKEKILKSIETAKLQRPETTFVVVVHPNVWDTIPEDEKTEIQTQCEIEVPSHERLNIMAKLMGAHNDHHFWDPSQVFLVEKKLDET
jgi:hypothetical protein